MSNFQPDGGVFLVDEDTGAMFTQRDWGRDESLAVSIAAGLAEVTGKDMEELEPLQKKVDVDAIESVFRSKDRKCPVTGQISFEHEGHLISISSDGDVVLRDAN